MIDIARCSSLEMIIVQGRGGDLVYFNLVEGISCRRPSHGHLFEVTLQLSALDFLGRWMEAECDEIDSFFRPACPRLHFKSTCSPSQTRKWTKTSQSGTASSAGIFGSR